MKKNHRLLIFTGICMTIVQLLGCFSTKKAQHIALAEAGCLKPFDAIIVPGVPFRNCRWDSIMKARVLWSYILYMEGYTKNVIYSGSAVYSPWYEAIIMGLYAEKLGIPREHIFCETRAKHSTENVYYSYLLAKVQGFKTLALATDPYQSSMLKRFTRKRFETSIYHIPYILDKVKCYNQLNPEIDPSSARATEFVSIRKKESFWHRLRGTFGKNIDWSQHPNGKVERL